MRRQGRQRTNRDRQAQEAAYLHVKMGLGQDDIRQLFSCSQSHVSRLLSYAVDRGWLQIKYELDIPEARMNELQHLFRHQGLLDRLQKIQTKTGINVREVWAFEVPKKQHEKMLTITERLKVFGRSAASRLNDLLRTSRFVGVTFGETTLRAIEGLETLRPPAINPPIQFVPVCGEVTKSTREEDSSSALADRLRKIMNAGAGRRFSLAGVQAFVSLELPKKARKYVLDEYVHTETYKEIFLGRDPLIEKLDTLVTSIGQDEKPLGRSNAEFLAKAGIADNRELVELVVGDIGGIVVPKPHQENSQRVKNLTDMWTGISLSAVEGIALRANETRSPGVIVVAMEKNKASTLAGLLSRGIINELIIDEDLAGAVQCVDYE